MELQAFSASVTSEVDERIRNILMIHHQMKIYKYEVGSDVWYHLAVKFSDNSLKVYVGKLFFIYTNLRKNQNLSEETLLKRKRTPREEF